jgi:GNAT superfamily N-acetyltransferase
MTPEAIKSFTPEHVEDASELLAGRLARQRAAEPLLALDDPTDPRVRGIGVALVAHAFAWAADHDYPVIRTDWRVTNLLASRFWPARGFRPVYLRLHRAVGIG